MTFYKQQAFLLEEPAMILGLPMRWSKMYFGYCYQQASILKEDLVQAAVCRLHRQKMDTYLFCLYLHLHIIVFSF